MNVLLDSHVLVDLVSGDPAPYAQVLKVAGADPSVWVSAATVWELGIKAAKGKLTLPPDLRERLGAMGAREVPVTWRHGGEAARLPLHHGNPFDRMLVAQARVEGFALATADARLSAYDVSIIPLQ